MREEHPPKQLLTQFDGELVPAARRPQWLGHLEGAFGVVQAYRNRTFVDERWTHGEEPAGQMGHIGRE
jgi:hypothetical protein